MSYSWMINFSDIDDESVIKLSDGYLNSHPSSTINYYNLTAQETILFAQSYGVDVSQLNIFGPTPMLPIHPNIKKWMIICIKMLVSQNLIGLNNDSMVDDKWKYKYQMYRDQLKALSRNINYETFLTANIQQSYTRQGGTFPIVC